MRNTTTSAVLALCTFTQVGCPGESAKTPDPAPQPLVVGTSPPAPVVTATAPPPAAAPDEEANGDAPRIRLGSLTTPGKVFLPARRVVVVHFFATWCEPCKRSLPQLQELFATKHAQGVEVIAVSVDDEEQGVGEFARKLGVKFPAGWDPGHRLAEAYKVDNMPTTFVIDREGNIARKHGGYHDGDAAEIIREVDALL